MKDLTDQINHFISQEGLHHVTPLHQELSLHSFTSPREQVNHHKTKSRQVKNYEAIPIQNLKLVSENSAYSSTYNGKGAVHRHFAKKMGL